MTMGGPSIRVASAAIMLLHASLVRPYACQADDSMGSPPGATNANTRSAAVFKGLGIPKPAVWTVSRSLDGHGSWSIAVDVSGFTAAARPEGMVLHIPGESRGEPGTPALPRLAKLLPGLPDRTPRLTLRGLMPTNVTGVSLAPVEGYVVQDRESPTPQLSAVRRPLAEIFGRSEFWPAELGAIQQVSMGTQRLVRIECFPIQYNPGSGTLRYYRRLEGVLSFD